MILPKELLGIILGVLALALAVGGFNYWQDYRIKKVQEQNYYLYLYENKKISFEEALKHLSQENLKAYLLALKDENPRRILSLLEEEDLKKLFLEKEAFRLLKEGKAKIALSKLGAIKKEDFNYPSALLLKAFIKKAQGEEGEAKRIFVEIISKFPGSYFAEIAQAELL